jgi:hypothetical protein
MAEWQWLRGLHRFRRMMRHWRFDTPPSLDVVSFLSCSYQWCLSSVVHMCCIPSLRLMFSWTIVWVTACTWTGTALLVAGEACSRLWLEDITVCLDCCLPIGVPMLGDAEHVSVGNWVQIGHLLLTWTYVLRRPITLLFCKCHGYLYQQVLLRSFTCGG